jgi:hypothetical protein
MSVLVCNRYLLSTLANDGFNDGLQKAIMDAEPFQQHHTKPCTVGQAPCLAIAAKQVDRNS